MSRPRPPKDAYEDGWYGTPEPTSWRNDRLPEKKDACDSMVWIDWGYGPSQEHYRKVKAGCHWQPIIPPTPLHGSAGVRDKLAAADRLLAVVKDECAYTTRLLKAMEAYEEA